MEKNMEKVYLIPWTISGSLLHPPKLSKTGQITPSGGFGWRFCYSNTILSFSFLFISTKSLKNHSKSQKNHKMKNLILLDSTWVDLHSEHIIWYSFVQNFWCSFRYIFFIINWNNSYVQLLWSNWGEIFMIRKLLYVWTVIKISYPGAF